MGLLDGLRGGGADLVLDLDRDVASPGDEIRARVEIGGELDDKAQGAQVGLQCVHSYLVRERDYDHNDDRYETKERWRHTTLHETVEDLPLALGPHEVTLRVPGDALPSSPHVVEWKVWAKIDRRRGLDEREEATVFVRTAAPAAAPVAAGPFEAGEGGVAIAELPSAVRAGDELAGVVSVTPEKDVKATGLKVRLRRVRTYTSDRGGVSFQAGPVSIGSGEGGPVQKHDDVAEVEVEAPSELPGGQATRIPFSIRVPDAGPTVVAPHGMVEWRVLVSVTRRMRRDLDAEAAVEVA
jgi:hypothetical protein